jgi:hypothetical protein
MRRVILASLLLTYLTACTIYLGGDDEEQTCEVPDPVDILLIDPNTLSCMAFTSDCGCGICDEEPGDGLTAIPTWGSCDSGCNGLDELTCMETASCRAAHDWACYTGEGPCTAEVSYLGCFPVDTTGPISGACEGNDAYWCSMHDNCIALHDTSTGVNTFVRCEPEYRLDF